MKRKILLLDDEESLRFGIASYLRRKGYLVVEASCLQAARARIELEDFDAFILDVNLPDGNGADFSTEIKRQRPHAAVLMISAVPDAAEFRSAHANYFFTKPVSMVEMYSALLELLDQN